MLKSIKQQYIDLKEGKMSQANFMRNLRMTLPQYVTNVTSFDDSVKILRNKGILNEADMNGNYDANVKWLGSIKDIIEDRWQNGQIKDAEYGSVMTKLAQNPESIIDQYGETSAEDAANKLLNSVSHLGSDYDPGPGEDEDFKRDYDADYEEPNEPFDMFESLHEAKDEKTKWTNTSGKSMYDQFKELDNLNSQEVLIGIDYEMEKDESLTKKDAAKIVIKNLKKIPNYYTNFKISGKEGYEPEYLGGKSANAEARQMQPLEKNMGNIVDKKMGMQPVKGIEKAKKDSDKGGETNKAVKGIEMMTLIAKTVRGLKKMDATGEKVKKVAMKEGQYQFNGYFMGGEENKLKQQIPDAKIDADTEYGQGTKTTVTSATKSDEEIKDIVNTITGVPGISPKKSIANSIFNKNKNINLKSLTKEHLLQMIQEELSEILGDGRDNVTDVTGENQ